MYATVADGIQVCRQYRDQGLALTGTHLRNIAIMQYHAADKLDIERPQSECAVSRLPRHGEHFDKQIIQVFAARKPLAKLVCSGPPIMMKWWRL